MTRCQCSRKPTDWANAWWDRVLANEGNFGDWDLSGWVYFIQQGRDGPIKIGYTEKNVAARVASLQTGNPHKLHLLGRARGNARLENYLHIAFDHHRIRGEWFSASSCGLQELIEHINSRLPV